MPNPGHTRKAATPSETCKLCAGEPNPKLGKVRPAAWNKRSPAVAQLVEALPMKWTESDDPKFAARFRHDNHIENTSRPDIAYRVGWNDAIEMARAASFAETRRFIQFFDAKMLPKPETSTVAVGRDPEPTRSKAKKSRK
jgi:hypothetical protein